jgi:hypothetical protein
MNINLEARNKMSSYLQTIVPEIKPIHLGGRVYRIGEEKACKIVPYNEIPEIEREERIGNLFYQNGIFVPKPDGIYNISLERKVLGLFKKTEVKPGLVREYIDGVPLGKLSGEDFQKALSSYYRQLEGAEKLGFDCWDQHFFNSLWVPRRKETCLIDLDSFGEIDGNIRGNENE